jgi:DNA-binding NarL/FixJ family response regulator
MSASSAIRNDSLGYPLTDAELKVVNLIAQGATNHAVADQLHLSLHTVKDTCTRHLPKLGIDSRAPLTQQIP